MKIAGKFTRLVAYIVDSLIWNIIANIVIVPAIFLFIIPFGIAGDNKDLVPFAILLSCLISCGFIFLFLVLVYYYYVWLPVKKWNGATLGKKVLSIRVVNEDGSDITIENMFVREFIGKFISGIIFNLGYLWILIDDRGQGWHDIISGTVVVKE